MQNNSNYQSPTQQSSYSKPVASPAVPAAQNQGGGDLSKLKPEDFVREERWTDIMEKFAEICPSVNGALSGSYAMKGGGFMLIFTENSFLLPLLRNQENADKLRDAIKIITGNTYVIRAKCTAKPEEKGDKLKSILDKAKKNDIPVE